MYWLFKNCVGHSGTETGQDSFTKAELTSGFTTFSKWNCNQNHQHYLNFFGGGGGGGGSSICVVEIVQVKMMWANYESRLRTTNIQAEILMH